MARQTLLIIGIIAGFLLLIISSAVVGVLFWIWLNRAAPPTAVDPPPTVTVEKIVRPAVVPEPVAPPKPEPPTQEVVAEDPWVPLVAPEHDARPEYAAYPYAPGWPIKVKGTFNSTPVIADLQGDGKLSVVITSSCVIDTGVPSAKPKPPQGMVFAINLKGAAERNFPNVLGNSGNRWSGGVSVFHMGTKDYLVVLGAADRKAKVIGAEGTVMSLGGSGSADSVDTPLLVDINHDGAMDVFGGRLSGSVNDEGGVIPNWSTNWGKRGAYVPVAGDVEGNGFYVMYQLMHTTKGTNVADVIAFDETGKQLNANWPKVIDDASWHSPVMGDICGDAKAEVVAVYGSHIFAWGWDGSVLPNTRDVEFEGKTLNGVLVEGVYASSMPPTLADLDGDGKAEILVFDGQMKAIRAWHGDGTPVGGADGIIAKIPNGQAVSVVSLGDEPGVMDLFCGTYWVRLHKDGKKEIKNMVPGNAQTPPMTQPTIVDVDGDGKADVVFVTSDGRMFIYQTGLKYDPAKMQWPTLKADFQHTGMWKRKK